MLRAAEEKIDACEGWAWSEARPSARGQTVKSPNLPDWQIVDRELRKIASRRAALDAEEARWLREAERCQIWRELGMVSALDYLERVLGYAPRTAQERLRVARALGELPVLTEALANGELAFSAIRELTRVAVPSTEASWCDAARGKNLRQIEELVADHKPGDRPEDPGDPEARTHVVRVELSAETFALWRQARQVLDAEHDASLSDDAMVAAMCGAVLESEASERAGRAKYQIAMVLCERCGAGWQEGAGVKVPIAHVAVERAMCDAQYVGRVDDAAPGPGERARQDIAPSVARYVWRRDGGRCRVPGCRSARGLELHHVVHRAHGGGHEATNLILLCSACHAAHHHGKLRIRGTADRLDVERCADVRRAHAYVGAASPSAGRGTEQPPRAAASDRLDVERCVDVRREHAHVGAVSRSARRGTEELPSRGASDRLEVERCADMRRADAHVGAVSRSARRGTEELPIRDTADRLEVERCADVRREHAHVGAASRSARRGTEELPTRAASDRLDVERCADVRRADEPADGRAYVGARPSSDSPPRDKMAMAVLRTQAKVALTGLGWKPTVAVHAVDAALAALHDDAPLELVIFEALKRCSRSVSH